MKRIPPVLLALLLVGACVPPIVNLARNEPYTVGRIVRAAAATNQLVINAKVADIVIDSTLGDSLIVTALLASHDAKRLAEVCAPGSTLQEERAGGELRLSIEQRSRDQCGERWRVQLPRNVAIQVNGTVANLDVAAATRELRVRLKGPGAIRGRVDAPVVDVAIDNGSIEIRSARGDVRRATAIAEIGSVEMSVRGLEFPSTRRPPGARAQVDGRGDATFVARSGNGRVKVIIE
jgi:hypothetical protein